MAAKKTDAVKSAKASVDVTKIIVGPRFTEKAARLTEVRAYTFDVMPRATKLEIKKAIAALYNVVPVKVTVMVAKPENTFIRGRAGTRAGSKKAVVFLKKGDSIDFA